MNTLELLSRFRNCRVLVVGDVMLDAFIWGTVSRISPEAPVPVVQVQKRTNIAGGAANTATNIAALDGQAILAGVVGDDRDAQTLRDILTQYHVNVEHLITADDRPTTTKNRIVAHSQQMVRFDQESCEPISSRLQDMLSERLQSVLKTVSACIVSDYGKGMIQPSFVRRLIDTANREGVPIVVDPKGTDYDKYHGATLIKPNLHEAAKVLNRELKTPAEIEAAGLELQAKLGASILITQGAAGMSLFERGRATVTIPTQAREVYDVTGAGDTVAGALTLAIASGANLETACRIATTAAAVVVGKVGTATVTQNELAAQWPTPLGTRHAA